MQFDDLLGRFDEVSEQPDGGFLAVCPAHGDSRPSLRLWVGDDRKVRLTCRAGCASGDVVRAAGLSWADLFDVQGDAPTVASAKPEMVGIKYTGALAGYVDDTAEALTYSGVPWAERARAYCADRFGVSVELAAELHLGIDWGEEAGFALPWKSLSFTRFPRLTVPLMSFSGVPRGLQGRDLSGQCPGRWLSLSNPDGFRWAPYGVFRGGAGYNVWIVTEGPGDGLTATALGYDSVVVRGASLVNNPDLMEELANGLRGRLVIVAGDADNAGMSFNRRVSDGLSAHGIDVHVLELPQGAGDVTAWREADPEGFPSAFHTAVKGASALPSARDTAHAAVSAELAVATGAGVVSRDDGHEAARILAGLLDRYGDTDAMNAHALVAWTDGRIKYARGLGFYVWNGRVWEQDPGADLVRQEIHRMGAALMMAGKVKEARPFAMTTRINDLMTELRSVPSVRVSSKDFDARPDLLSFRNGTVELRTGRLRPHAKHDMLTYVLALDYDAAAACPRWEQFLVEIFPENADLVGYIQRLVGYGITGHTDEQCFGVLWGKGANGKSVLTDTLSSIFGVVSKTTPFATFEEKQSGGIPNDIASLRGARLVMASEGESGKPMSEAVLKRVTGKDMVSARFLRQEFFEFKPSFLLLLATNHKPKFRGQDDGLWRRVKLIPFKRFFAPHERDHDLDKRLLAEAQGIAAWAVRGAQAWFAAGLADPATITQATQEYKETSDALSGFFPGVLERAEGHIMLGSDAYNSYRDWCEAEGLQAKEVWKRALFYEAMEERGITKKRVAKGMALRGVALAGAEPKPTGPGIFGSDD
jgi:putative DNA primase/helicase